jgi:hypothetical protein
LFSKSKPLRNQVTLFVIAVMLGLSASASAAFAGDADNDRFKVDGKSVDISWKGFGEAIEHRRVHQENEGLAYMISGSLVAIGSGIGMAQSDDAFAKAVYSISQSLGIASIGYGAFLYSVGDEDRHFYEIIESTHSLSIEQKNEILRHKLDSQSEVRRRETLIRIITHSLIAGVNIYNASREHDDGAKDILYFVGGVNAVAALALTF